MENGRGAWRVWFVSGPGLERDVYVSALQSAGFETDTAGSLEELRERLADGVEPDLLFLDLLPAPEDAWRLISQLCATSRLGIIVFTTLVRPDRANRDRARQLGCAAFVAKPCSPLRVVSVARQVCQGARGLEVIDYT